MSFAQEEIMESFEEATQALTNISARELLFTTEDKPLPGFHVILDTRYRESWNPKPAHRKMYNRAFTAKVLHEQIKERILRGERPKTGGRGRPPTRWWRVADELGIDIGQLPPILQVPNSRSSSDPPAPGGDPCHST